MRLDRFIVLFALAFGAAVVGCGPAQQTNEPTVTDGGSADAGTQVDAGPAAHESYVPDDQRPTTAARIIVMGDSISAGVGASRSGLSYFNLLAKNDSKWSDEATTSLSALFDTNVPVLNVAESGATTSSVLDQRGSLTTQLPSPVSGHSIVVITIGGNDLQALLAATQESRVTTAVNNAVSNVRLLINYLQDSTRFPDGNSIYLAAVYDPSDSSGTLPPLCFGQRVTNQLLVTGVENLRARYISLGKELHFAVVDALGHFHGHGVESTSMSDPYYNEEDPSTWFNTANGDCIHPNDTGHNELRRVFFEAINYGHYSATY